MKTLSIVIPFLNEEKTISKVLDALLELDLSPLNYQKEILLVNDGSTDKSVEAITSYLSRSTNDTQIMLFENDRNRGKGYSLKVGFAKASGEVMIVQDADMEYDPRDYIPLLKKLESDHLDFVYGSRIRGMCKLKNTHSTVSFFLGGLLVSFVTSLFSWILVTDEPTCYKMYTKKCKPLLLFPPENGFEREPAATMFLLKNKFRYGEVPIHYKARKVTE
jgi:glycosyltransferase involved in cell wall biosynthesis